jgi:hypothetical protein
MRVRALTSTGDWTFGAGANNYLQQNAAVAQMIATNILMVLGDCFFATNEGINWFGFLGGKNDLGLSLAINAAILNTDNVTGIVSSSFNLDDTTRAFTITYIVSTAFGNVEGVVTQNLGIGILAPLLVNPYLPQFNQVLLNNVTATAITNAVFPSATYWEVDLDYYIEIRTSTNAYKQRGTLRCIFDPSPQTWSIVNNVWSGSSGPVTGVVFTINSTSGQVYYASDNISGSGYVGNLIIGSTNTFVAGA